MPTASAAAAAAPDAQLPILPAGIADLEEWGRTIIETGAHKNRTYADVVADVNPKTREYLKWILARRNSSAIGPALRDFGHYVFNAPRSDEVDIPVTYPGSDVARRIAPVSPKDETK